MAKLPGYDELAQLVVDLAEMNVSNIDGDNAFVTCFTFEQDFADHLLKAMLFRKALLKHKLAMRGRKYTIISKKQAKRSLARVG